MGWKERPPCVVCGSPSMVFMFDNVFCGGCVIDWNNEQNEMVIKQMKERVNGSKNMSEM